MDGDLLNAKLSPLVLEMVVALISLDSFFTKRPWQNKTPG